MLDLTCVYCTYRYGSLRIAILAAGGHGHIIIIASGWWHIVVGSQGCTVGVLTCHGCGQMTVLERSRVIRP